VRFDLLSPLAVHQWRYSLVMFVVATRGVATVAVRRSTVAASVSLSHLTS